MKPIRIGLYASPALLLLVPSCKEVEETTKEAAAKIEEVAEVVVPDEPELPAASALSPEQRAAKLGFVGHLSGDTEWVMSLYDGKGMVNGLRSLEAWQLIREIAKEEEGVDPEEELAEGAAQAEAFLGQEMFIAGGSGMATQLDGMMGFQTRMSYHQMRSLAKAFAEGAATGDIEGSMSSMSEEAWIMEMAREVGQFMPAIEAFEVPPILAGLKISDEEAMGMAEQQIRSTFGMFGEEGEPVEFEKGGATMSGILLKGEMLAEEMEAEKDEMSELLGADNADKIIASVKTKNLVVACGKLDDYLLLFIGGDADACPIADDVSGSLAANEAISYIDGFEKSSVYGFVYASKGLSEMSTSSSLGPMADGIRDGLKDAEGFGDTREIAALLDMVGQREEDLLAMVDPSTIGAVISSDQGVRFDLFGADSGAMDYDTAPALASLGDGENTLFFANWVSDAQYQEKASELVELLAETAYATVAHLSRLDVESEQLNQLKGGFQMFDSTFREDLLSLWKGLGTMGSGLGNEAAIVVDLNADFPPIPEVPKGIVEEGRFIRASMVAPVEDRAKLQDSWKMVDQSVRGLLASAKEAGMPEFHMLEPTSSDKGSLTTWYFDAFAFSDDLKPSVTVGDDWFVASSSKTQALDLLAKAEGGSAGRKGAWFKLDLDVLRSYLTDAAKLVDKHGDDLFGEESVEVENYRESLPDIMKGLAAMKQFEAITMHDRMVGDDRQVTLHFKVR